MLYHTENIYVPENSSYSEINKSIQLPTVRVGGTIVLRNIFFGLGTSTIKKESKPELDRIYKRFSPLVKVCKENGTAMRIGTNHGSLSDRIMNRYGDTPFGMVESALEFCSRPIITK